jgi:hypothetical protein
MNPAVRMTPCVGLDLAAAAAALALAWPMPRRCRPATALQR